MADMAAAENPLFVMGHCRAPRPPHMRLLRQECPYRLGRETPGASDRSLLIVAVHSGSRASHTSGPSSGASPQKVRTVSHDVHASPSVTPSTDLSSGKVEFRGCAGVETGDDLVDGDPDLGGWDGRCSDDADHLDPAFRRRYDDRDRADRGRIDRLERG